MDIQLSVIVNVKNGERTLNKCLSLLSPFTDIIVFDNYSTDKTIDIAKTYLNVNIVEHEFCGMGKTRNLAATYAKYDWVLFIDCDEVLHPDLVDKLRMLKPVSGTIYSILRHNFYANRWIESSAWENDWVSRLYNRNETRYTESEVHEGVICENMRIQRITSGFIYHFPYIGVNGLIDKMQTYSTWYANENYTKRHPRLWSIPFRALFMFIKCYILKRGFLDGFEGFVVSSYNAIGVFSKYVKLYELYNKYAISVAINVDKVKDLSYIIKRINLQKLLPERVYILVNQDLYTNYNFEINMCLSQLCVSANVFPAPTWRDFVVLDKNANCVLYLEDNDLLEDQCLIMNSKKRILAHKPLHKIQLITLR